MRLSTALGRAPATFKCGVEVCKAKRDPGVEFLPGQ